MAGSDLSRFRFVQVAILQIGSLDASLNWLQVFNFGFQNSTPNCVLDVSPAGKFAVSEKLRFRLATSLFCS